MTKKQEEFCLAYAKSGNATQSAIEAGYSERTARSMGAENLTKPDIKNRLQELAEEAEEETEQKILSIAEIQAFLTRIIQDDELEENIVIEGVGNGITQAKFVNKKPSLKDKVSAADKLIRMQGGYQDKVQIDGTVPVVLCDDVGSDLNDET